MWKIRVYKRIGEWASCLSFFPRKCAINCFSCFNGLQSSTSGIYLFCFGRQAWSWLTRTVSQDASEPGRFSPHLYYCRSQTSFLFFLKNVLLSSDRNVHMSPSSRSRHHWPFHAKVNTFLKGWLRVFSCNFNIFY